MCTGTGNKHERKQSTLTSKSIENSYESGTGSVETCMQLNMPSYKPMKSQVLKPLPDIQKGLLTAREV
jgi:hypothetical protein